MSGAPIQRGVLAALGLLAKGAVLRRDAEGRGALVDRAGRSLLRVSAAVVTELEARSLVVERDGAIGLSPEGIALLRRERGGANGFLAQHTELGRAVVRTEDGAQSRVAIDLAESPLAWLRRRKDRTGAPLIDDAQLAAGERLRADATRAQMLPRITANWDAAIASGRRADGVAAFSDGAIAARSRVGKALEAVGPELAGVLLDVCCFLKGIEAVETERDWPVRSGRVVLGLALTRLAAHYGYGVAAVGPERARMSSFRAEGAKPVVMTGRG